ncbi:MAG: exodeoxyribonuclease small subunit [Pseudonocardiales bacterium]|jgi:exodeoxyribonuclease VII small subunit|nr:exodeoxyribonuclease small subunit [Pseudonocardiales bacterium]
MDDNGKGRGTGHTDPASLGYEAARDELTEVVRKLEAGGLSLEDSLALWERGELLAAACERHLAGAQERIEAVIAAREQQHNERPLTK